MRVIRQFQWQKWFVLAVVATPLISVYGIANGYAPNLHMSSWLQVISFVFCIFLLQQLARQRTIFWHTAFRYYALFLLWLSLSVLWSQSKPQALLGVLHWGTVALAFTLFLHLGSEWHKYLFRALSIVAILVSCLALGQYFFDWQWLPQVASPSATFSNKNLMAHFLVIVWPATIYCYICCRNDLLRLGIILGVVLIWTAIFYSFSRGAWLALLLQITLLFITLAILRWLPHRQQCKHFIIGCTVLWALCNADVQNPRNAVQQVGAELQTIATELQNSGQDSVRIAIWSNTLHMIKGHWLWGVGINNWSIIYPLYHQSAMVDNSVNRHSQHKYAHNDYLQLLAELGVVGYMLILIVIYYVLQALVELWRSKKALALSASCVLVGTAVIALFSFPLNRLNTLYFVIIWVAIIFSQSASYSTIALPRTLYIRRKQMVLVTIVVAVAALVVHSRWYIAERNMREVVRANYKQQYQLANQLALVSYRYNPWQHSILNTVAATHFNIGNSTLALQTLEQSFKSAPYSIQNRYNAADWYLKNKQYRKAADNLKILVHLKGKNFHYRLTYTQVLLLDKKSTAEAQKQWLILQQLASTSEQKQQVQKLQNQFKL